MKTDATKAAQEFKRNGITVCIRPTIKDGKEYFVCDYRVKGKRKLVWRSTLADARQTASDAVDRITAGQAEVLQLTSADAHAYLRARDTLAVINAPLDHAARDYAEAVTILAGRATVLEAAASGCAGTMFDCPRKPWRKLPRIALRWRKPTARARRASSNSPQCLTGSRRT